MEIKEQDCEFCKIIREKLDKDIPICPTLNKIVYKYYKKNFKIRKAVGLCRGKYLCKKHMKTIKKDNLLRVSKDEEIPNNLDVIKKIVRLDI